MAERIDGDKYPSNPTDWKEEKIVQMQDALAFCGWSIMDQQNIMDPTEGFISEHDGKPAHRHLITKFDMLAEMALGLNHNKEMMEEGAWHEVDEDGDIVVYHYTQEVAEQLQQCFAKAFEVARLNAHDLFEAIFQMQTNFLIYQADPENYNLGHIPLSLNQVQALLDNSESEEQQDARRQNVMRQTCMNVLIQLGCALHNAESGETAIIPHLIPEGLQPMVEDCSVIWFTNRNQHTHRKTLMMRQYAVLLPKEWPKECNMMMPPHSQTKILTPMMTTPSGLNFGRRNEHERIHIH